MHIYMFFSSCMHAVKKIQYFAWRTHSLIVFPYIPWFFQNKVWLNCACKAPYPPPYFRHLLVGIKPFVKLRFREDYFRAAFHCIGTIYVNHAIKEPRYIPTQWVHSTSGHYLTLYNQKNQHSKYNHLTSHRRKLLI